MALPIWREAALADLETGDPGWRYDDPAVREKLATSLRRHGQLRALVVRTRPADGRTEVVDGRQLLAAMRALGWERGMVVDVGALDGDTAHRMALDLETRAETDFAALAAVVGSLLEGGAAAESLAAASPFTAERIGYFGQLASFDWSQFSNAPEGQGALEWDAAVLEEGPPVVGPPAAEPVQLGEVLEPEDAAAEPVEIFVPAPPAVEAAAGQLSLF